MDQLLNDFLRLRCTQEPSAAASLHKIVSEMRSTCRRPLRRDEVMCGLSQLGFKFAIIDRRVYVEGLAFRA